MPIRPITSIRLSADLDREIEAAFSQLIYQPWSRCGEFSGWQPAVDVYETDDEYLIEADLPGVSRQDLELRVDERQLTLRGQRRSLTVQQSSRGVRLERALGEFQRTITFEHPVDAERIDLRCEQGILQVRLPKRKPAHASRS